MNRKRLLKQRAARKNVFIYRRDDGKYDIVDSCGLRDLALTKRTAINMAAQIVLHAPKIRVYITTKSGAVHRGDCEQVAPAFAKSRPCKCDRLVIPEWKAKQ